MATPPIKEIRDFSPLNQDGKETVPAYKRNLHEELSRMIGKKYILAITGMRRVGKSVLMKQLLNECNGGYFSFDEARYRNVESLSAVIDFLLDGGHTTIGLDEIAYVPNWAGTIKKYYDQKNVKFILSGSAALGVKKGKESLAGRMLEYSLPGLQFDEYLEMKGIETKKKIWEIKPQNDQIDNFLVSGSFPEIQNEPPEIVKKYVTSLVEKVLFEDIGALYNVEHKSKIYDLLKYIATFSAGEFSETSVANTIGLSRNTVQEYTLYLSQSFLASVLYEIGSYARALQKTKKAYICCASIYRQLADTYSEGTEAETAAFDRIKSWGEKDLKFYRDYYKREIDFMVGDLPIEVKYRTYIKDGDFDNILYVMKQRKIETGVIVTKEHFDVRKFDQGQILMVPLSVFLRLNSPAVLLNGFK